jgi:hypothetical protein
MSVMLVFLHATLIAPPAMVPWPSLTLVYRSIENDRRDVSLMSTVATTAVSTV